MLIVYLAQLNRKFLDASYEVDVSYFAAGIISNLADDWPVGLHFACGTREDLLTLMVSRDTLLVNKQTNKSDMPTD